MFVPSLGKMVVFIHESLKRGAFFAPACGVVLER
jgi:hypothetical protein